MKITDEQIERLKRNDAMREFGHMSQNDQKMLAAVDTENCQYYSGPGCWFPVARAGCYFFPNVAYRINPDLKFSDLSGQQEDKEASSDTILESTLFCGPATIVQFPDGTKTVSKAVDGDKFDPVFGYLLCYFKKYSGMTRGEIIEWLDYLRSVWAEDGRYES